MVAAPPAFDPPVDLAGKVALVSGASRGVGRTYALALAHAGATVMAIGRTAEGDPAVRGSLAELAATAERLGLAVATRRCDASHEAEIVAAVAATVERFGGIDILVNNAVWTIGAFDGLAVPPEEWEGALRINVLAPYAALREAVPHMRERGGGAIVNITSGAAGVTRRGSGAHGHPAYAVSKAALERLTTYYAAELAGDGVAVNSLSPGNVGYYTRNGDEPDLAYWGEPLAWLASQRPPAGLTGEILHTYGYGSRWGAPSAARNALGPALRDMLEIAVTDGMAAAIG